MQKSERLCRLSAPLRVRIRKAREEDRRHIKFVSHQASKLDPVEWTGEPYVDERQMRSDFLGQG